MSVRYVAKLLHVTEHCRVVEWFSHSVNVCVGNRPMSYEESLAEEQLTSYDHSFYRIQWSPQASMCQPLTGYIIISLILKPLIHTFPSSPITKRVSTSYSTVKSIPFETQLSSLLYFSVGKLETLPFFFGKEKKKHSALSGKWAPFLERHNGHKS